MYTIIYLHPEMSKMFKLPYNLFGLTAVALLIVGVFASLALLKNEQNIIPEASDIDPTDTSYDLGVLVVKYFPLTSDGLSIDLSVTGDVGGSYDLIRQKTVDITNNLKDSLEKSTRYLGYKNPSAPPSLRNTIVDTKEYTQKVPIKPRGERVTYPDYNKIMSDNNICNYVDNNNVREVWLWAYQGPNIPETNQPYLGIDESKMSSPFGDISNSWRFNDMPICAKSYRVYTLNYGRGTAEAIESWGHQLEAEMNEIDRDLFSDKFQGANYPTTLEVPGRCGSVHNPPNARWEYDRDNKTPNVSDCLDWDPDGLGQLSQISCVNWGCDGRLDSDNAHLNAQIWVLQNMPGRQNTKYYQGRKLRNWWDVHGDFDAVMGSNRSFFLASESAASPSPTKRPPPANPSSSPTPVFSPQTSSRPVSVSGDLDADGDLDIFDYNVLVSHFGKRKPPGFTSADIDSDNDVDIFDYNLFVGYYLCRNGCE